MFCEQLVGARENKKAIPEEIILGLDSKMDTNCKSRFCKKIFWKVKVSTTDQAKEWFTDKIELLIGPLKLYCYPNFRKRSHNKPIALDLTLTGDRLGGHETIFNPLTNISANVEIIGTKRIIGVTPIPVESDSKNYEYWQNSLPISFKELQDPSNGFIVDEMFTFLIHVHLVLLKCVTGPCCQKSVSRAFADNKEMFLKELMADFEIETNDKVFKVNKFALATRSPVFYAMFSSDLEETKTGKMKVIDIASNVMEELLRYIYCNEVKELNFIVSDLALAANKYQVGVLQELCCNHMSFSLNVKNVLEFLIIADLLNEKKLLKECLDMIGCIQDKTILSSTPEWEKLTPQLLELIEQHETNIGTSNTITHILSHRD